MVRQESHYKSQMQVDGSKSRIAMQAQTLAFGRSLLISDSSDCKGDESVYDEIVALICFEEPGESPLSYLLDVRCRIRVSELVNDAILAYQNTLVSDKDNVLGDKTQDIVNGKGNRLERMCRQIMAVRNELGKGGAGISGLMQRLGLF